MPSSGRAERGKLTSPHADRIDLPIVRVRLTPRQGHPSEAALGLLSIVVGTDPSCDLVVDDPRVSRRHCEVALTDRGIVVRDLGSKNGVLSGGLQIVEGLLAPGVEVTVGGSRLTCHIDDGHWSVPLSSASRFGDVVGRSVAMRALFAQLERAAQGEEPILLLGEGGTGKDIIARAIHARSPRRDGPFVVLDCRAVAPEIVEPELFGHRKVADQAPEAGRPGLLAQAREGTLYIAGLEELPLAVHPRLLRALELRAPSPLDASVPRPSTARVIAAASRDLRVRIATGAFLDDLYRRLSEVVAQVPPLRERREDIPMLVERLLAGLRPPRAWSDLPPNLLELLTAHSWPGNDRELTDVVLRLALPRRGSIPDG